MRQIPKWTAATYGRNPVEIVFRRWRRCGPLERPGVPGIITSDRAMAGAIENIPEEHQHAGAENEYADRRNKIQWAPPRQIGISKNATRHSHQPQKMLHEECGVKSDQDE